MPVVASGRWTVAALLALTMVTGLIDAVSFLGLGGVFVANMTGNVIFLGLTLHPSTALSPLSPAIAISGFVLGALLGGRSAARLSARPQRWLFAAFAGQAGILAVVAALVEVGALRLEGPGRLLTVAVLAAALGLQNSTVRRLGFADLTTTVLTLALTGLVADSRLGGGQGAKPVRRLGSILAMLVGAGVGALLLQISASLTLAVAAALVGLIALTLWHSSRSGS